MNYDLEKQHAKGKLHAIERIESLLDPDSFYEIGQDITNIKNDFGLAEGSLPYDGVIVGSGRIYGQKVYVYSQDFTVLGGTLGRNHGLKIANAIKAALKEKCPIIGINDSGGARIQEGIDALSGYGEIFYYNTLASGVIPQIAIIAGPCAGGAVYSPGIMDFIFTIDDISTMFVTGPKVIKSVTNEEVSANDLGGAGVHMERSGVAHFRCKNEVECYKQVRQLVDMIPHSRPKLGTKIKIYTDEQEQKQRQETMKTILPDNPSKSYDMKEVINLLVDSDSFLEIQENYAKNIVIGFAYMAGNTVGIVASQPQCMAGVLDCNSSDKAARFIRYCDSFDIPIITLTDVPGFLPGTDQEYKGIIRHGAKLLYAYSEATSIKLNVIIRKAYGGAYISMCSKHLRADAVYAWPTAEIAVMGAEPACQILYAKDLKKLTEEEQQEFLAKKSKEYQDNVMSATNAITEGYINEVIQPVDTRERILRDLVYYAKKKRIRKAFQKKSHGNIPL